LLPLLTVEDCRELIASKVASGGMQAKLNAASDAVSAGVGEVRIAKGSEPEVLKKNWNGGALGTRIVSASAVEVPQVLKVLKVLK